MGWLVVMAALCVGFVAGWCAHHTVVRWHVQHRDHSVRYARAREALARNARGARPPLVGKDRTLIIRIAGDSKPLEKALGGVSNKLKGFGTDAARDPEVMP